MYIADLHIHSQYSRATSRQCVPEHLDLWARRKGIGLIGTGDFTHPAWREELRDKLIPMEEGLYGLREDLMIRDPAAWDDGRTRFVVSGEISCIYKKDGRVRKVHNLILLHSLEDAEALSHQLEAIGNIHSDGRPILGISSHDLLEITLETCPDAVFIPAHIWTPHFSLFGAFSGFDSIEQCFGDLTPDIHALETGLSSDPPMNWRVSALDRFTLISNSDAHSPSKLGREANLLETDLSYPALAKAIQQGEKAGFRGTIEFFPEEGKYHLDGHRNCKLCLTPSETQSYGGICPVCGKKLVIGVQHRVEQLADRAEGFVRPQAPAFESLVPLPEVIAASTGMSPASKKTAVRYDAMLAALGPEFWILRECPLDEIRRAAGPCVEEGIRRLRTGQVERIPGYDGEYGKIQLLSASEIESLNGQMSFFAAQPPAKQAKHVSLPSSAAAAKPEDGPAVKNAPFEKACSLFDGLNEEQLHAVTAAKPAVSVIAGPGTGKTRTLIARIAYLMEHCGVKPSEITAVTFTNKAAGELRERLEQQLGGKRAVRPLTVGTFHSICLNLMTKWKGSVSLLDEYEALDIAREVLESCSLQPSPHAFLQAVSRRKNGLEAEAAGFPEEAFQCYQSRLSEAGVLDFDDLLLQTLDGWEAHTKQSSRHFAHVLVDEFQDMNDLQYRLLRAWSGQSRGLFVIGDPDQSIYGFRGSDSGCFHRLEADFPDLQHIRLVQNYRSTPEILSCSLPVISENEGDERILKPFCSQGAPVRLITAQSDLSEAIFIAKEINRMAGGIDMLDAQSFGMSSPQASRSFSDIAVLYRTHHQAKLLEKCLRQESIPYTVTGKDDFLSNETVRGALGFFRFLCSPSDILPFEACLKDVWGFPADLTQSMLAGWRAGGFSEISGHSLSFLLKQAEGLEPLTQKLRLLTEFEPAIHKEPPRKLLEQWAAANMLSVDSPMEKLMQASVFFRDMPSFLQNLLTGREGDVERSERRHYASGAVRLMTLHGSKGLEFPVVFLCGVKRGCIPLETAHGTVDLPEERRLFYVGMTRAKEELILMTSPDPSPFLSDIPALYLQADDASHKKPAPARQISLFD